MDGDASYVKITYEKLLLAGIILLAGACLEKGLERSKQQETLGRELAAKRVKYIGDVWAKVDGHENTVRLFVRGVEAGTIPDLAKEVKRLEGQSRNHRMEIKKVGFWLGRDMERRALENLRAVDELLAAHDKGPEAVRSALESIDEKKTDVTEAFRDVIWGLEDTR